MHKHARRIPVLAMVEDDSLNNSSMLGEDVSSESVLSERFVESVVMPDNIVVEGIAGMDTVSSISTPQEADKAKEVIEAAMSDPGAASFIGDGGLVREIPTATDQVILDDMMPSPDIVSAFLAASEEAVAAAEAKLLTAEEAELVPLIPKRARNDTVGGVATEVKEIPTILPASQVVGEPFTAVPTEIATPNVKKILKFAIPAIAVWLCGPLLSLIDTSAVGLFSGTYQQAALNPAVAVTDYAALLIVSISHMLLASNTVSRRRRSDFSPSSCRRSCTLGLQTWLLRRRKLTAVLKESLVPPRTWLLLCSFLVLSALHWEQSFLYLRAVCFVRLLEMIPSTQKSLLQQ